MRPQFARLLNKFDNLKEFSEWLGCTHAYARVMASRGYMSKRWALVVQERSQTWPGFGNYKASRLVKERTL